MNLDLTQARQAAEKAADAAQEVISGYLSDGNWQVSYKSDQSPVTEVDVAAEQAIKSVLTAALPEAEFYGEETGRSVAEDSDGGGAHLRWLVDPIDGTKSFIRAMPFYSTQIALSVNAELQVGVSNAPAYGERLVAVKGQGVFLNAKPVNVSDVSQIDDAFLSSGNLTSLARDVTAWTRYASLVSRARRVRGYGDFCHYHQLCCGQTDIIIESDLNILDIAALSVGVCLLYTSPSPRDRQKSRMPSSA